MWKVQTGYQAPFWCTLLVFTWDNGQCFTPSIIMHQDKDYSKDLHFNIPLDWSVYHKKSGYMDRDRWLKSTTQFSNVCSASPVRNIFLFNGHNIHFYDREILHKEHRNIQPLILKLGDSVNNHTNDNRPNYKLNSLYNEMKYVWMLKYGTICFTSPHELHLGGSMGKL